MAAGNVLMMVFFHVSVLYPFGYLYDFCLSICDIDEFTMRDS